MPMVEKSPALNKHSSFLLLPLSNLLPGAYVRESQGLVMGFVTKGQGQAQ